MLTIDGIPKTYHEAHQDLWNELSQKPGMTKDDYFKSHDVSIHPQNKCFACENCYWRCSRCPITLWRKDAEDIDEDAPCAMSVEEDDEKDGLYREWLDSIGVMDCLRACEIAKQIADLEWKEVEE